MPVTARLYPKLDDSFLLNSPNVHSTPTNKSILDLDESINFNVSCITCRDTCPICKSSVLNEEKGLGCDGRCSRWFHASCLEVDDSEYKFIQRMSNSIKFFCPSCFEWSESFKTHKPAVSGTDPPKPALKRFAFSKITVVDIPPFPLSTPPDVYEPNAAASENVPVPISAEEPVCSQAEGEAGSTNTTATAKSQVSQSDVRIVYGAKDPLSNMFSFDFWVNNCCFKSLEQAYHFDRAYRQRKPHVAHQIMQTSNPFKCKQLARSLQKQPAADVELMRSLLRLKLDQCNDFRSSLIESIGKTILHSTHVGDTFWCTGLEHDAVDAHCGSFPGKNKFGMLLTELRDNSLKFQCEGNNNVVSLLNKNVSFPTEFNALTTSQSRCHNCFEAGHSQSSCGFKGQVFCRQCGKKGHKQKFCKHFFGGNPNHLNYPITPFHPPPFHLSQNNFMHNSMFNYSMPHAYSNHHVPMPNRFRSGNGGFIQQQPSFLSSAPVNSSATTQQNQTSGGGMSGFPSKVFPK